MRLIDGDSLHGEISKWPESVMYKDWVQSAIANAPTIAPPPNDPLTVEELREMDGEPVYCRSLLTGKEGWAICRVVECGGEWYLAFSGGEQAYGDKDTIWKNWLAYRRKPEEETK